MKREGSIVLNVISDNNSKKILNHVIDK